MARAAARRHVSRLCAGPGQDCDSSSLISTWATIVEGMAVMDNCGFDSAECAPEAAPPYAEPGRAHHAEQPHVVTIHRPAPDRMVAEVSGEIDNLTAPGLLATIEGALSEHPLRMLIDLDQVTFLGSAGLAVLAQLLGRRDQHGCELQLRCSPTATRALQLSGLITLFTVVGGEAAE